jgi:hypothetical protein
MNTQLKISVPQKMAHLSGWWRKINKRKECEKPTTTTLEKENGSVGELKNKTHRTNLDQDTNLSISLHYQNPKH